MISLWNRSIFSSGLSFFLIALEASSKYSSHFYLFNVTCYQIEPNSPLGRLLWLTLFHACVNNSNLFWISSQSLDSSTTNSASESTSGILTNCGLNLSILKTDSSSLLKCFSFNDILKNTRWYISLNSSSTLLPYVHQTCSHLCIASHDWSEIRNQLKGQIKCINPTRLSSELEHHYDFFYSAAHLLYLKNKLWFLKITRFDLFEFW